MLRAAANLRICEGGMVLSKKRTPAPRFGQDIAACRRIANDRLCQ